MWSDWMIVPWVLGALGVVIVWLVIVAAVVVYVEERRHPRAEGRPAGTPEPADDDARPRVPVP